MTFIHRSALVSVFEEAGDIIDSIVVVVTCIHLASCVHRLYVRVR